MVTRYDNKEDTEFIEHIRRKAESKVEEYNTLMHERDRVTMLLERTITYIDQLNEFLEAEGQAPIRPQRLGTNLKGSIVGKPGNRNKDFPVRKSEWIGMTLDTIVKAVFASLPNKSLHVNEIAHRIYEIQTDHDLRRVKNGLVSTLRRGAKKSMWEALKGNTYRGLRSMQERLISN